MTTRFLLVRHARVADAWHGRVYGDLDVPLSPEGREQSQRAAAALSGLGWDAILDSGLARARYLAQRVRPLEGEARDATSDPRLREIGRGEWAGLGRTEVEARYGKAAWERWVASGGAMVSPGGESFEVLAERVHAVLDERARHHDGGLILAVAHRWAITSIVARALGLAYEQGARLGLGPCCAALIDWPADPRGPASSLLALGPVAEMRGLLSPPDRG